MRKMSKFAGLLDKYGNVDEDTERHLGKINWSGHIKAQGSFIGSAFISGYQHDFIATDLKSDSNPRGSILQEAKNYTDSKVATAGKTLYAHYIRLRDGNSNIVLNYISSKAEAYTIATLKADLKTNLKKIVCNGYCKSNPTQYITVNGESFVVATLDGGGTITRNTVPTFNDIQDYVEAI